MKNENWLNNKSKKLFEALSIIDNEKDMADFCRDLMTETEIEALSDRWQAALLLAKGLPQRDVSAKTGVSIATVTRVNQWLNRGAGGYANVLKLLQTKKSLHQHTTA